MLDKNVTLKYVPLKSPLKPFLINGKYYTRDEACSLGYNKECSEAILNY